MHYETVIGLEIHAQLKTDSKIFSGAATTFGAEPNTQACSIDLGLPGVLPVLNQTAVEMAVRFGLSVQADIAPQNVFARKNYFYPDLPKGYQISQFESPIVGRGHMDITLSDGSTKRIGITRAHLEEDAGKSLHEGPGGSAIDLNRAGTPLLEIVSEPDLRSAEEAIAYLKNIHQLVKYLGICDGNMQEGSFRCDVNISLRPHQQTKLGTRTELKNMNSFRFIERAILFEVERQSHILDSGQKVVQETRQYDPDKDITRSLRSKEEAHDYRYFPDPDLLPVAISQELLDRVKATLPELPEAKRQRFIEQLGLSEDDANQITANKHAADYFEAILDRCQFPCAKLVANWVNGELNAFLNKSGHDWHNMPVTAERLAPLFQRIHDNTISNNTAKQVFTALTSSSLSVDEVIEEQGLKQITDNSAIEAIIDDILANNPTQLQQLREGKDKLFGFFVGQVMKATQGKANPQQVNDSLKQKIAQPQSEETN